MKETGYIEESTSEVTLDLISMDVRHNLWTILNLESCRFMHDRCP